jgi:MFS family permease
VLVAAGAAAVVGLGVVLLRRELRHPDPVLQPRFFANRAFAAANAAVALSNLAMYSTLLTIPLVLARRDGWTEIKTGLVLTSLSAASAFLSPRGGRLADRIGRRTPAVFGLALFTLGLLPLALTAGEPPLLVMLGGLALAGAGLGLSSAAVQTAALEAVGMSRAGVAAGVYSTSRYLGSIVGSSVLAGLLGSSRTGGNFGAVFVMVAVAAVASALAVCGLPGGRPDFRQGQPRS